MSTLLITAPALAFAPTRGTVALLAVGAIVAGAAAVLAPDAPGRLLLGAVAALLLAETVRSLVVRPVLRVDETGVTVRRLTGRELLPWPTVVGVSARLTRRFVASSHTLEVDLGDRLVVLPRYRLGRSPDDVADLIESARPLTR